MGPGDPSNSAGLYLKFEKNGPRGPRNSSVLKLLGWAVMKTAKSQRRDYSWEAGSITLVIFTETLVGAWHTGAFGPHPGT